MNKRHASILVAILGCLVAVLIATGQEPRQEWTLKNSGSPGKVQFTVERRKNGSSWSNSNEVPIARFHGLSRDMIERGGPARFEYVHDAGSLVCEGTFTWNRGSGTYTFEPNSTFPAALGSMGYDEPNTDQLFTMLMSDITLDFARAVRDADPHASTRQLMDLRNHGVSAQFLAGARRAGYKNFSADDFIQLAMHGVSTDFLSELKADGYNLNAQDIVELAMHGVSGHFVADLKDAGYNLSSHEIVDLSNHGVSSNYLRDLHSYGLRPSASDLVQLTMHGVNADYLAELNAAGYGKLSAGEITDLRSHGVSTRFIREAKDLGYDFTPQELMDLTSHGVDARYLRHLKETGMKDLTASQIEKLRMHGVD